MKILNKIFGFFVFLVKMTAIIIVTLYYAIKMIILMSFAGNKLIFCAYTRNWSRKLLKIAGIKVSVSGAHFLDKSKTYIFISNHSSLFDIPILFGSLDNDSVIMYKKELEKIPIFGYSLHKSPFIAVERSDAHSAMTSIENTVKLIQGNVSVIIFPEGTRSLDGTLGEFRRGAFMVGIKSLKPIVPISIIGSNKILQRKRLRFQKGNVNLIIHEPITNIETNNRKEEKEFIESVRKTIGKDLELL
jgi:1-acyl-sn-glycerol-3-phosphate acyltransferase